MVSNKERIKQIDAEIAACEKKLSQINSGGMYWCNSNRVIQSFDTARKLCRKVGRRLRYSDEERSDGCLAVQIQRTTTGLGAAPHELQDGSYSALQIARVPDSAYDPKTPRGQRSRDCQTTLEMRVDAEGHTLRARVWMHRPLPIDCRIKSAQITWRDGGARGRRWQLALTISRPKQTIVHPHPTDVVGIDVGWRVMEDGSLRVAVCADADKSQPLRVAGCVDTVSSCADIVETEPLRVATCADSAALELRLPAAWMQHQDWIEQMQSDLDTGVIQGEKAIRRAQLLMKGGRSKDLGERREIYRLFARRIAMRYGIVAIEHIELAVLARNSGETASWYAGRAQRQRACIHQLLAEIKNQCAKHGATLIPMQGPSTMQCHHCGKIGAPADRTMLLWTCDGCGTVWDQDVNAAINLMLAASLEHRPENAVTPVPRLAPAPSGARKRTTRKPETEAKDALLQS